MWLAEETQNLPKTGLTWTKSTRTQTYDRTPSKESGMGCTSQEIDFSTNICHLLPLIFSSCVCFQTEELAYSLHQLESASEHSKSSFTGPWTKPRSIFSSAKPWSKLSILRSVSDRQHNLKSQIGTAGTAKERTRCEDKE